MSAVGVVWTRWSVDTHWQHTLLDVGTVKHSLNTKKCEPGVCSGEETRARGVWQGGGEGAGGRWHALAAFKYSLNT